MGVALLINAGIFFHIIMIWRKTRIQMQKYFQKEKDDLLEKYVAV